MKNIRLQIENYREFLNFCWPSVEKVMSQLDWDLDAYWADDFMQGNWKFLVERALLADSECFQDYGFGKTIHKSNTHKLICIYNKKRYLFRCLSTLENGGSVLKPPFNKVYAWDEQNSKGEYFSLQDLEFDIEVN